jgi:hypothetical protein
MSGAVPLFHPYALTVWTETADLQTEWMCVELFAGLRAFTENTVLETFFKYVILC